MARADGLSVKPLTSYSYKDICPPAKAGYASCDLYATTSASGKPIAEPSTVVGGLGPTELHTAYNLPCTPGGPVQSVCSQPASFGPTVAIVDAGSYSDGTGTLSESLGNFDSYYGLPSCTSSNGCLNIVNEQGQSSPLPAPVSGWTPEITLDVETVHMMCQTCKIVLVEATNSDNTDMAAAEATAATFSPIAISNSWGSTTDATGYDSNFELKGTAVVAATGDSGGNPYSWPADNPGVVAVSGTTLSINANNTWAGETVWSSSGGGCSATYAAPLWQTDLSNWSSAGCGSYRSFGDVSADADPNSGINVNLATSSTTSTWSDYGGTSLATPIIASMFALANNLQPNNVASSVLYSSQNTTNSHDITSGSDCTTAQPTNCTAGVGFDTPSGLGSPNGTGLFGVQPATAVTADVNSINQNGTGLTISWTPSTQSLLGGYDIYSNGKLIGTAGPSASSYAVTGLTPNTSYTFSVQAYDKYGNDAANATASSITTYLPADINEDGHINLIDLSLLAAKYGQSGPNLGRADINHDGTVNLIDLSLLAAKYGSE